MNQKREILYNMDCGGFGLSKKALDLIYKRHPDVFPIVKTGAIGPEYRTHEGIKRHVSSFAGLDRTDSRIIKIVKELGLKESSGLCCQLGIKVIPRGYSYRMEEHDGAEDVIIELPYCIIIEDLRQLHMNGSKDFKSVLTQKIIDGDIKLDHSHL